MNTTISKHQSEQNQHELPTTSSLAIGMVATIVVLFLDNLDDVVAFAHCNRQLRTALWDNEETWKAIVLSQMVLFPGQETELDKIRFADPLVSEEAGVRTVLPSCSWRHMALSLNNVLRGRFHFVELVCNNFDEEDAEESSFEDPLKEYGSGDEDTVERSSSSETLSSLEAETMSFVHDEEQYTETPETPSNNPVEAWWVFGEAMHRRPEAHYWWSAGLYKLRNELLKQKEKSPLPPHILADWKPLFSEQAWGDGSAFSPFAFSHFECGRDFQITRDGYLVLFSSTDSERSGVRFDPEVIVANLCNADRIKATLPRLDGGLEEIYFDEERPADYFSWQTLTSTDLIVRTHQHFVTLYWNLSGPIQTYQFHTEYGDPWCGWECVYQDYGWVPDRQCYIPHEELIGLDRSLNGCRGKLQWLDRSLGTVQEVYSCSLEQAMSQFIFSHPNSEIGVPLRASTIDESGYVPSMAFHLNDIVICGKVLIMFVGYEHSDEEPSEETHDCFVFVVDMKKNQLLYGVRCPRPGDDDMPWRLRQGVFRGGLLAFDAHGCRGMLFTPTIPTLDSTHSRVLQLFKDVGTSDQQPEFPHPSFRRPLHELVETTAPCLCDSTEQQFIFPLFFTMTTCSIDYPKYWDQKLVCRRYDGVVRKGKLSVPELHRNDGDIFLSD